jgi:multidrug efflux pump subunit AcrA (membrane-fusion protein)
MKIALIILLATAQVLAAPKAPKKDLKKVFIQKIEQKIIDKKLSYPVVVTSRTTSAVRSPINGVVTNIHVSLGQKIKAGKKLIAVKQYENGYEYRPNHPRAMVNGVVSDVYVAKGQYVNKGDYLIALTDPNNLYAKMEIALKDKSLLKVGQTGSVYVEQLKKKFPVKIIGIGSNMNPITGTFASELEITDSQGLISGVLGKASIELEKQEKILIPLTALNYVGGKTKISTLVKNKIKKVEVKIGAKKGETVELLSGVELGEKIVVRSSGFIADGDEVEVVKE